MNIIENITNLLKRFEKPSTALVTKDIGVGINGNGWSLGWGGYTPSSTGTPVSQYTSLGFAACWACIKCISDDTAKIPLRMRRLLKKGGAVQEKKHPVAKLLRQPNYFQTPFEFISYLASSYTMRGNAYAYVRRDVDGTPVELIPLMPDRVQIMCNPLDGAINYVATHPRFGAMSRTIIPEDMLHIRGISIDDGLTGVNPIAIGQNVLGIGLAVNEFAGRVFKQGAMLRGILTTDGTLSPETAKSIAAQWEKTYSGQVNAHKTAVLEQGLKYQSMTMDNEQVQLLESRSFSAEEAARFYRVPGFKIGINKAITAGSLEQLEQSYINDTLMPLARRIEEVMEARLLFDDERDKYEIRFDFDAATLRADTKNRFDSYQIALLNGMMNIDEVRAKEGMAPVPDGKGQDFRIPLNQAALDSDSVIGAAMTTPKPKEGIEVAEGKPDDEVN